MDRRRLTLSLSGDDPSDARTANHYSFQGLEADGNLVLYGIDKSPRWQHGRVSTGDVATVMQNDGNLVTYISGKAIWSCSQYLEFGPSGSANAS